MTCIYMYIYTHVYVCTNTDHSDGLIGHIGPEVTIICITEQDKGADEVNSLRGTFICQVEVDS